jgi:hypothetical protein
MGWLSQLLHDREEARRRFQELDNRLAASLADLGNRFAYAGGWFSEETPAVVDRLSVAPGKANRREKAQEAQESESEQAGFFGAGRCQICGVPTTHRSAFCRMHYRQPARKPEMLHAAD